MTTLGSAVGPGPAAMRDKALNDALDGLLRERGDSLAALREVLARIERLVASQQQTADSQLAASRALATAAERLADVSRQAPPTVNVDVSPTPVTVDAPVSVTAEPQVEVMQAPPRRCVKTVHRGPDQLIDTITEDWS